MRDIIDAIIYGIVQGFTEFLPVSSSGHIEIVKFILDDDSIGAESLTMTIVLHFATALSTVVIFRKDIVEIIKGIFASRDSANFIFKIIVSMVPAVFIGIFFESFIESLFNKNLLLVGAMLLVTGFLLFVADQAKDTEKQVSFKKAIIIGIAQAIAILPGISRSGATISTSVLLGVDRSKAARFSFLMVIPLIFGKIAKDLYDGGLYVTSHQFLNLSAGFIAAFITGIFACTWMIQLVKRAKLRYFSYYCFIVGFLAIISFWI